MFSRRKGSSKMSERAASHRMTSEQFLEWCLAQEERYELVDGVPVAMTGARRRHDQIVVNLYGILVPQLRGRACRPFTADTAVRIPSGNVRRPDAGVDCGAFIDDAMIADAPFLVIEVPSPSTRQFDMFRKLEEYKSLPTLRQIVMIDPDQPEAQHWAHSDDGTGLHALIEGLDSRIELTGIDCAIDLETVYAGLTLHTAAAARVPGRVLT